MTEKERKSFLEMQRRIIVLEEKVDRFPEIIIKTIEKTLESNAAFRNLFRDYRSKPELRKVGKE